jgi:hypothetical protein
LETVTDIETARIITVSQIVEGDVDCYCGKPAVLVVDTSPDGDPGPVCFGHAMERITFSNSIIANIFGSGA